MRICTSGNFKRRAVTGLVATAALWGAGASSASAGNQVYQQSVHVNGVLKAHSVYYQSGRMFCARLYNAPNVGAYALTRFIRDDGTQFDSAVVDVYNDGERHCRSLSRTMQGRMLRMITTFHNANDVETSAAMWIVV
jgi:hypothetical protein